MSDSTADLSASVRSSRIDRIIQEVGLPNVGYWTNQLRQVLAHRIGVVKISGKLLDDDPLAQLAAEMAYLQHEAGINLPLVFGGGVKYDEIPGYHSAPKVNGLRVTSEPLLHAIKEMVLAHQTMIVDALKQAGATAIPIPLEVVVAQRHGIERDKEGNPIDMGFTGDVESIDTAPIMSAIHAGYIPVVGHVGTDGLNYYNINATHVATDLVRCLRALKLLVLGDSPVLKDGRVIPTISSSTEVKRLIREGVIGGGMITNCEGAYTFLKGVGPGHSVQMTSLREREGNGGTVLSTGLLEELIGSGTGTMLTEPSSATPYPLSVALKQFGREKLQGMINHAFDRFGKYLVGDYFDRIMNNQATVYVDNIGGGLAVVYPLPSVEGVTYLCKLAIEPDYEGIGVGRSIMFHLLTQNRAQHRGVAWRVSMTNSDAIAFYDSILPFGGFKQHHASRHREYYTYGVAIPEDQRRTVCDLVCAMPVTLLPKELHL